NAEPSLFNGKVTQLTSSVTIANSQAAYSAVLNLNPPNDAQTLAFVSNKAAPGNFLGFINFTLNNCPSGVINIFPDANTQTAGPVVESVGNGNLTTVAGSITVTGVQGQATATPTSTPGVQATNTPTAT